MTPSARGERRKWPARGAARAGGEFSEAERIDGATKAAGMLQHHRQPRNRGAQPGVGARVLEVVCARGDSANFSRASRDHSGRGGGACGLLCCIRWGPELAHRGRLQMRRTRGAWQWSSRFDRRAARSADGRTGWQRTGGRQRTGPGRRSSGGGGTRRRGWLDESGAVSLEYLLVTMTCGLLAAVGLIAAVGPRLVSSWSERRACLYDGACQREAGGLRGTSGASGASSSRSAVTEGASW